MDDKRDVDPADDGRPAEERRAQPTPINPDEELPDESTVESVGY